MISLIALAGAATLYTVELTHYRADNATAAQNSAHESRDLPARVRSLQNHVRGRVRVTLRPGETRRFDAPGIKGSLSIVTVGLDHALDLNAPGFSSGITGFKLCREQMKMASRQKRPNGIALNLKTLKVSDRTCRG